MQKKRQGWGGNHSLPQQVASNFARCVLCKLEVVISHPDTIHTKGGEYELYWHRTCYTRTYNAVKGA